MSKNFSKTRTKRRVCPNSMNLNVDHDLFILFAEYMAQLPSETHRELHLINERNAATMFATELVRGMLKYSFIIGFLGKNCTSPC